MNPTWTVVSSIPCVLGESPIWHPAEKKLFWVDIVGKTIHRIDPKSGEYHSWLMPDQISCIAPNKKGGLIAALKSGIAYLHPISSDVNYVATLPNNNTMCNDGHCDNQGRFWMGTKDIAENNPSAGIFCFANNQLIQKAHQFTVTNGLIFSLDSRYFYVADSPKRIIYRYDFDADAGEIHHQTVFAVIPEDAGYPDGMTIDSEGYLWNCHFNGWRVTRYAPDGKIDRVISVPTQAPSSCCFGDDDLKTIFVTTAKRDVKQSDLINQPLAGCVLSMRMDVAGVFDNGSKP